MNARSIPHSELTGREVGMVILDKNKKRLGCIIRLASGLYAAWGPGGKIGAAAPASPSWSDDSRRINWPMRRRSRFGAVVI